ncbi:MAG: TspO/MBR family protein [bacterium]|nr:TspO/MBR family protein [bacterium]
MLDIWNWQAWYQALTKPSWTPSGQTIGTIWSILYPIIFVTFAIIFYKVYKKKFKSYVATPFIINLVANLLFTPIQFGLKNLPLAVLDILIVWVTIIWGMRVVWKYSKILSLTQIPYLIWVTIATILQLSIALSN